MEDYCCGNGKRGENISIGGVKMILDSFITWDFLSQYMGVVIVTMILVQFVKELPLIKSIPTKYLVAIIAFLTLLSAHLGTGKFSWGELYLIFLNSILVTMTATGGWDFANPKVRIDNPKALDLQSNIASQDEIKICD